MFARRWLLIGLLLTIAGIILGLVWRSASPQRTAAPTAVATVERGTLKKTITATGMLQPREFVDVGTQVSGLLKSLLVEPGDTVTAGQLLAEIDPTLYQSKVASDHAKLANLRAQQAEHQAKLTLAEQQYQRQKTMISHTATSVNELQIAEANHQVAQAQLAALAAQIKQAESELRGNEANLSYTKIIAPMSGVIVSKVAKQGQTLNANQQTPVIVRIADLSTMTVEAQVSEADITQLRLNMPAYFSILGNSEQRWHGQLRQILPAPQVVNNVVLYYALFDVPNDSQQLMISMTAQVFFIVAAAENALLIPASAVQFPAAGEKTAPQVQVIDSQGNLSSRSIKTGISNRIKIQVLEGLEVGETVVLQANRDSAAQKPASVYANPSKRLRL